MPVRVCVLVLYVRIIFLDKSHGNSLLRKKIKIKAKLTEQRLGGASADRTKSDLSSISHGPQQGFTATSVALTQRPRALQRTAWKLSYWSLNTVGARTEPYLLY